MRTLIISAFVSVDGVVEAPGGEPGYRNTGWTFKGIESCPRPSRSRAEQKESAAMLMGRASYGAFAPVWPNMAISRTTRRCPSTSSRPRSPTTTRDNGAKSHPALRRRRRGAEGDRGRPDHRPRQRPHGKSLADAGLMDRYHLLVFPLLLGAGSDCSQRTTKTSRC